MPGAGGAGPRRYAVAGAGVLGVCLAARLAEAGAAVTLLERDQPGQSATRSSFAWLNSNDKAPRAYHDLNHAGILAGEQLADHCLGEQVPLPGKPGNLGHCAGQAQRRLHLRRFRRADQAGRIPPPGEPAHPGGPFRVPGRASARFAPGSPVS